MRIAALFASAAAPTLVAVTSAWAQPAWPPSFGDWGWGHMAFGGATMLLVWGGIILLIVLLVRGVVGFAGSRETGSSRQTAVEVLQERYARGEIDKDEFEDRRRTLAAG